MRIPYDSRYPSIDDLRDRARRRVPRFIFEFLDGGCNEHVNLRKNTAEIRAVELRPVYLRPHGEARLTAEVFGRAYDAPFGVAPIGLQGLIWPGAAEILARAAVDNNLPFILSTCSTASIERIGEITGGDFWFQLYNPVDPAMLDGVIVSNHGGRQLDAGQSAIHALVPIVRRYAGQITIMFDSGIRSGPDIARVLASGAEFVFLGRGFMVGVAARGAAGGRHTIAILTAQLRQVMEQLGCDRIADLPQHLVGSEA